MRFVTTAREIQAASTAGLELVGAHQNNTPQYNGTREQFEVYTKQLYAN